MRTNERPTDLTLTYVAFSAYIVSANVWLAKGTWDGVAMGLAWAAAAAFTFIRDWRRVDAS